jgi:hypothetical protein
MQLTAEKLLRWSGMARAAISGTSTAASRAAAEKLEGEIFGAYVDAVREECDSPTDPAPPSTDDPFGVPDFERQIIDEAKTLPALPADDD